MKFDDLVPRFVAAHQFDGTARAIQLFGQQPDQRFVRGGVHRRRGDSDSQFVADPVVGNDFIGGRARLEFHGEQDAVGLRTKEIGEAVAAISGSDKSFVLGIDEPERRRRQRAAGEIGDQIDPQVGGFSMCMTVMPVAMAGLKAPPEMPPSAKAITTTVKPMASPK